METGLDAIDKKLLNLTQREFPLVREPFSALGLPLDLSGEEVIRRLGGLKAKGIIRQIGPILDARSLGYQTTLVTMRIAESSLDKAAPVIVEHPGVSHCYQRDHRFNLWFTLALPGRADLQKELRKLQNSTGAEAIIELPALKVFKLRTYFDVSGEGAVPSDNNINRVTARQADLSPTNRRVINELQQDLPLIQKPFDRMSAHLDMEANEFLSHCLSLKNRGIVRGFGISVKHSSLGFAANAMVCWIAPPGVVDMAGQKLAALQEVSHCYERKTHPLWQYNLFAMIHGHTRESCQSVADRVSREHSLNDVVLLFSTREFKKVRINYAV